MTLTTTALPGTLTAIVIEQPRRRWPHKVGTLRSRWDIPSDWVQDTPTVEAYQIGYEIARAAECPRCGCTGGAYFPFSERVTANRLMLRSEVVCCRQCGREWEL